MADSAKGKSSKYKYVVHAVGRGHQVFNSETGIYYSALEAHNLIQRKNIKIYTAKGKDVTESVAKRCAAHYKREQAAEKKRLAKEAKVQELLKTGGYYCDCKLCNKYKDPEEVPLNLDQTAYDQVGKWKLVPVSETKDCLFCGYAATYFKVDPKLNMKSLM